MGSAPVHVEFVSIPTSYVDSRFRRKSALEPKVTPRRNPMSFAIRELRSTKALES